MPKWAQGTDLMKQVIAASTDTYITAYRTTMLVFAVVFTFLFGLAWHFLRRRPPERP